MKKVVEKAYDVRAFKDKSLYASERTISNYTDDNPDPIPLLYQTGYLTIKDYDSSLDAFVLAFPNDEVKYGFLECLLPVYVNDVGACSGKDILALTRLIKSGELNGIS